MMYKVERQRANMNIERMTGEYEFWAKDRKGRRNAP